MHSLFRSLPISALPSDAHSSPHHLSKPCSPFVVHKSPLMTLSICVSIPLGSQFN
ncbi:hypothetical protein PILCRDRAFT_621250 [Piloderma croceum F 1598]|uniref:Uncharacterized protein n=1 Tax=Piloderma croceum (strain F 1598) TaxID=765440 RepID=A0A0C3FCF1_PILCF|nr:hypothetical protein PILCRDRAFT_621250 [Piloderma croceum F 1598]